MASTRPIASDPGVGTSPQRYVAGPRQLPTQLLRRHVPSVAVPSGQADHLLPPPMAPGIYATLRRSVDIDLATDPGSERRRRVAVRGPGTAPKNEVGQKLGRGRLRVERRERDCPCGVHPCFCPCGVHQRAVLAARGHDDNRGDARGRTSASARAGALRRPGYTPPGYRTARLPQRIPPMIEVASVPEHRVDPAPERTEGASSIRWHWLYLLANVPLVAAIFALPRYHTYLWGSMGLCSIVAIVVGELKNRPSRRAPWTFVAIAQFAFVSGGISYDVLTRVLHDKNPFPSIADVFYLATYPLLAIGLFLFVRAQSRERNVGALLDSLIVTVGLALLSWIYLIEPYVRAPQLTFLTKAVSMAYPLGDIVILYLLARLLLGGLRRNTSVILLSAGGIGFITADSIYRWSQLHGNWSVGGPTALGCVAFFVFGGTAALHPSMREVTEKQPSRPLSPISLAAISVSTLVAPALLVARSILNPTSRRWCAHRYGLRAAVHPRHAEDHRIGPKPSGACPTRAHPSRPW